jgi:hypothetical protein
MNVSELKEGINRLKVEGKDFNKNKKNTDRQ